MLVNEVTYRVRGAAFRVHSVLGPGLLESVYEAAMAYELQHDGLSVRRQVAVPMQYKGIRFDEGFRLDLLVEQHVIVEIKSVESLHPVHFKQLTTYLRLTDTPVGLLINFNTISLQDKVDLRRIINPHRPSV